MSSRRLFFKKINDWTGAHMNCWQDKLRTTWLSESLDIHFTSVEFWLWTSNILWVHQPHNRFISQLQPRLSLFSGFSNTGTQKERPQSNPRTHTFLKGETRRRHKTNRLLVTVTCSNKGTNCDDFQGGNSQISEPEAKSSTLTVFLKDGWDV